MADIEIDQDLYSRQLYVLGLSAMKRMAQSNVLIFGLDGAGVEIAKNIILAGVKTVMIMDDGVVSWFDLASHFYASERDIGRNRAEVSFNKLSELNPYVVVRLEKSGLSGQPDSFFQQFQAVVLCGALPSDSLRVNSICHAHNITFVSVSARGFAGSLFVDCGTEFDIHDLNGEEPLEVMIAEISKSNPGIVKALPGKRHGLEDGQVVRFSDATGMTEINGLEFTVKVIDPYSFSIGDTTRMSPYTGSALATQVKVPVRMSHKDLASSIKAPEMSMIDFGKMDNPMLLHIGMQAIMQFAEHHSGQLPRAWSDEDAEHVVLIAQKLATELNLGSLETSLIRLLSHTAQGQINGIAAFFGGVAAQEVLKGLSGKFTPLNQWMFLDAVELVPVGSERIPEAFAPKNDRLDGLRVVVGEKNIQLLGGARVFMVGSGAIGCEMLKNLAMMGVSCRGGLVTLTDNDLIEKSNLNRQFLFRPRDIGHPKSASAARAVSEMNSAMHIEAHTHKVCEDTENIYSDSWWGNQSLIINALDNIQARLYTDSRCVRSCVPLLESGTMGTKGHVQVIVPHITVNYGATRDPPDAGIPFCTLKSFPSNIEHCIQWARDKFTTLFKLRPQELQQLLEAVSDPAFVDKVQKKNPRRKELLHSLKLVKNRPTTLIDCAKAARAKFDAYFEHNIDFLLSRYPPNATNSDGTPFWALPRRAPTSVKFGHSNSMHVEFLVHATALMAKVYGVKLTSADLDPTHLANTAAAFATEKPVWKNKHIETNEQATGSTKPEEEEVFTAEERASIVSDIVNRCATLISSSASVFPEEFEKDDDTNHHIDFINAASNIRASQYGIHPADRLTSKKVAGKIIPAMATSTAAVTGLASIEILKILRKSPLSDYKNAWLNLALPTIAFSEPQACPDIKINDHVSITLWDRWDIREGDLALGQLINYFKKKYSLIVTAIIQQTTLIWTDALPDYKKRIPLKMSKLLETRDGVSAYPITVSFETLDGAEVVGPPVVFHTSKKE